MKILASSTNNYNIVDELKDNIVGGTFNNNGKHLPSVLEQYVYVQEFRHNGNFVFSAVTDYGELRIYTRPVDEDYREIVVTDIILV